MTYEEALEYIHSVSWKGSRPGLERITELCKKLGDPQKNMKFVHVTGTNGKGSTCAMTEIVLRKSGYKTGLFTSPYVRYFNERMAVNGNSISNEMLAEITEYVRPFADSMEDKPTEFELITAIAFEYFRRENCDVVVLEVGMGGRLDSTNIIEEPLVSVITGISLDHTAFLGDTEEKIAAEKAGIIKKGCPVVYGGRDYGVTALKKNGEKTAFSVIKEKAEELDCPFSFCEYGSLDLKKCDLDGAVFDYKDRKDVKISLLGLYQPQNAVKALEVIDALRGRGLTVPEEAVREGLAEVKWSARFEKLSEKPLVLYDGSHNPEGIAEAQRTLKYYFGDRKVNILTGVMADKDYTEMAAKLAPLANKVFTVTPDNPRSLDSRELAKVYKGFGVTASPFQTVESGYELAFVDSLASGVPLVCLGSLYMYAEVAEAAARVNAEF
ncbi:MAG: bifunctional folylpolyglutamate synthase/dihydrofolate synthase [Ruminococcaceae bacterium]|nr:bifunctional folylpolyglutamate synthase/dihydrofolate synthase [Oscillospiraceae bacterium]